MEIPKPSEEDKEYFRAIVPEDPRVEVKPMFGNVAAFVNGNMFMGLFGPDVGLRLAEPARAELEAMAGAGPFGPAGRPMGQYVTMPAAWRDQPDITGTWVQRSLDHVAAMPAKQKKSKK